MDNLGRYQLLGLIAAGGMAKVYLARVVGEGGFEREVAVKLMHDHLLHDADFVAMFLDEARLAARIRHPNVVPTLDVQKSDGALFLVMEFIEGLSLSNMLRQQRHRAAPPGTASGDDEAGRQSLPPAPLPLDVALRITVDLLSGLHAAHELTDRRGRALSIVHRDVSPANVLIGADGISRITDFGVARAEARLASTHGKVLKGKVPYLSPEQISADEVDRRSDVYSVATVLWEMLTGRRLFQAENEGAVLNMVTLGTSSPRVSSIPPSHSPSTWCACAPSASIPLGASGRRRSSPMRWKRWPTWPVSPSPRAVGWRASSLVSRPISGGSRRRRA